MTRFDYLRSARPAIADAIPDRWRVPALALAAACVVFGGTWMLERAALQQALNAEGSYRAQFAASEAQVAHSRARFSSITGLLRLRSQARAIARSSGAQARVFFALAQAVPEHVWLTSVTRDGQGFAIAGQARSFELVAQFVRALQAGRALENPVLASATAARDRANVPSVSYQLRADLAPSPAS